MFVNIAICDDSADDIKRLSDALYSYNDSFRVTKYTDAAFLLEDCADQYMIFDILFLDIYMPGLNGIETAKKIRALRKDIIIIFASSSNEHYPEAYDVFAFNYIIKPINTNKLTPVLDQALMNINKERGFYYQFSYKSTNYRILCRDIMYLESSDKIIMFHMADKSTLQCYAKMDEVLKDLPADNFIRCHQSFSVNILHITEMAENHFRMGTTVINISKKFQKASKDKYFEYLFKHMNDRG